MSKDHAKSNEEDFEKEKNTITNFLEKKENSEETAVNTSEDIKDVVEDFQTVKMTSSDFDVPKEVLNSENNNVKSRPTTEISINVSNY